MKKYIRTILLHPVTHVNILSVGVLILIGALHNHAHHSMEIDADSFVFQWCRVNPEECKRFSNR
jgi:hypothetical protein